MIRKKRHRIRSKKKATASDIWRALGITDDQIEQACEIALTYNAFRLRAIRELIKRGGNKQEEFEFLAAHEIIRDMADYGELVRNAFGNQTQDRPACGRPDYMGKIQTKAFSPPPLGVREKKKHSIQETFG